MNKDKKLEELKHIFKKLLKFSKEEFNTLKLEDGTQITITTTELEVGSEVYIIDDSGNQSPLDNGTYTLQDGRTFTIYSNLVTEIASTEGEGDVQTGGDETKTAETPEKLAGLPDGHEKGQEEEDKPEAEAEPESDLAKRVDDLEKTLAEVMNIINKIGSGQNEVNEQMMSKIREFAESPGDKPILHNKKGYDVYSKKNISSKASDEAFERLMKISKEFRSTSNNNFI